MPKVLVVEDEKAIADTLIFALQQEGFECEWVSLGNEALALQQQTPIDLWILDIGLPDLNGFDVCRKLRQFSEVPVLFLTARDSEIDRIVGLEIGADDYVVKPFSPREVAARVKVILKRTSSSTTSTETSPVETLLMVDEEGYQIYLYGQPLNLTRHEFNLLSYLIKNPKRVLSREQLLNALGIASEAGYERNIDSHIKAIRAKIRGCDSQLEVIQTHRGFGYSYDPK